MSASREKKQRQGGTALNKGETAQQQAAALRKKTIQYTVIGVVVAILVAALLIWNTGFFQGRSTAVTIGNTSYSAGELSYYYHTSSAYSMVLSYSQYGLYDYDTSISPAEQTYTTDEETGEVTTFHDYFLTSAIDELTTTTALYDAAIANGYTAADVQESVNASIDSFKSSAATYGYTYAQFLVANYGKYVTPAIYENALTRMAIANLYYSEYSNGLTYTDEEYQTYYSENADTLDTFEYSYLYFTPASVATTDADGNDLGLTEEEISAAEAENLAEAKENAEAALAAYRDGTSIADLITEYAPTSSGDHTTATGSTFSSAVYAEWLTDASRHGDESELIENGTTGYYVVVFHDRYLEEDTPVRNTRHILITAEMDEGAEEPTDEQMSAAKARAEELLAQWKNGRATETTFGIMAGLYSTDSGSNRNGGLYTGVEQGNFVPNYDAWLFDSSRQPGDTDVLENRGDYFGYHVVYYVDDTPVWKNSARSALASDALTEWLEGLEASYTATQGGGVKYVGD